MLLVNTVRCGFQPYGMFQGVQGIGAHMYMQCNYQNGHSPQCNIGHSPLCTVLVQYNTYTVQLNKYLEGHTKSVRLIRGTYHQYWLT